MKCLECKNKIHPFETYGDFYYCDNCDKTYHFHRDSSKREDSFCKKCRCLINEYNQCQECLLAEALK